MKTLGYEVGDMQNRHKIRKICIFRYSQNTIIKLPNKKKPQIIDISFDPLRFNYSNIEEIFRCICFVLMRREHNPLELPLHWYTIQ